MGPGLDGSRQLEGGQPPPITTGHAPLDSPCLCESNAANHASIGWELVEPLCNMGPGLDGSSLLEGSQPPLIRTGHTLLDSPGRCKSNGDRHLLIRYALVEIYHLYVDKLY